MNHAIAYDPEVAPDGEAWLALDELERIAMVEEFHRRAKIETPQLNLHAVIHTIVENQVAMKLDPVVRAIPRLMKQGLSRHDAVHAIASVLADHLFELSKANAQNLAHHSQDRFNAEIEKLSAKEWFRKYGAP